MATRASMALWYWPLICDGYVVRENPLKGGLAQLRTNAIGLPNEAKYL